MNTKEDLEAIVVCMKRIADRQRDEVRLMYGLILQIERVMETERNAESVMQSEPSAEEANASESESR